MKFIKEYPLEKYKFTVEGNKVTAEATYCGKPVKAIARCNPEDEFSLDKGKELAAARCNLAIASKRKERSNNRFRDCMIAIEEITKDLKNALKYKEESAMAEQMAKRRVKKILKRM